MNYIEFIKQSFLLQYRIIEKPNIFGIIFFLIFTLLSNMYLSNSYYLLFSLIFLLSITENMSSKFMFDYNSFFIFNGFDKNIYLMLNKVFSFRFLFLLCVTLFYLYNFSFNFWFFFNLITSYSLHTVLFLPFTLISSRREGWITFFYGLLNVILGIPFFVSTFYSYINVFVIREYLDHFSIYNFNISILLLLLNILIFFLTIKISKFLHEIKPFKGAYDLKFDLNDD